MQNTQTAQMGNGLSVSVGDIFYASWGYDQTNINFVKVVSISSSGKSVKAVSIGQKTISEAGFMSEHVAPDPENVISPEVTLKLDFYKGGETPERTLRGSYYYTKDDKQLKTLWRYKEPMLQSHYA